MQNNILNDTKEIEVSIKNYQGFADSSPVGTFVFSILCFAFWAADLNLLHDGGQLAIGLLQFGVFITYMMVGGSLIQKGKDWAETLIFFSVQFLVQLVAFLILSDHYSLNGVYRLIIPFLVLH